MLKHELYKIFMNRAAVLFAAAILLINVLQLFYLENNKNSYSVDSYNELWQDLDERALSGEEWSTLHAELQGRLEKFTSIHMAESQPVPEYTGSIYAERSLYERVQSEVAFSLNYKDYLDNIEAMKNRFQSFGGMIEKDTYVYRNLIKNAKAYENIKVTELVPEASAGVELASHSDITDFLALILFLYFGITVWIKEREQGMLLLIRTSMKGRMNLAVTKMFTLVVACVVGGICLYLSNLLVAIKLYGLGDLSRPLASVYMYGSTLWNISVGEFLILNILVKIAAYIWITLLIGVVCSKAANSAFAFGSILAISGISCVLYYNVPNLSVFVAVKYLNPFAMIKTETLFVGYKGLNFFGFPIDYRICLIAIMCLGYVIFYYLTARFFVQHIIKSVGIRFNLFDKIVGVWIKIRRCMETHTGIIRHELYRIFISYKIIYIVLIALILQIYVNQPYTVRYFKLEDYYTRQYLEQLSGPVTEEKIAYIESEQARLRRPADENEREQRNAVFNIVGRLAYLEENEGAYFVYDEPLNLLTAANGHKDDLMSAVLLMILLVLCMPCFFAPDLQSGMNKIIAVTRYGRTRLVIIRYVKGILLSAVLAAIVYLPEFMQIMSSYKVNPEVFGYPVNSILHLSKFGSGMSIGMYYGLVMLARIVAAALTATFIYKLSGLIKSYIYTMFASFAVLLIPTLIVVLNIGLLFIFYPYSLFGGNLFMQSVTAALTSIAGILVYFAAVMVSKRLAKFS